jgi:hypothetical protein
VLYNTGKFSLFKTAKMKQTLWLLVVVIFFAGCEDSITKSNKKKKSKQKSDNTVVISKKGCDVLKDKPIDLGYTKVYADPQMKNLHMIGAVCRYGVDCDMGKILRILRFKNISDAVEARYSWIPRGTILAMMAQESGGADLLPNGNNDGGIGSIHMQGSVASEFGLDTYKGCDDLVCHKHGRELRALIERTKSDKKKLAVADDRFNPVLNLDAVGRMLTFHACGKQIRDTKFHTAICRYAGKYNYRKYLRGVEKYRKLLSDKSYLKRLENKFNELNPDLTIDGKKADFKKYIEVCQKQNENYGLSDYVDLGKYK